MIEIVKIAHPLREITLEYDRSKPETECERKLISMLLLQHDFIYELLTENNRLCYEVIDLEEMLDKEMERYNATETEVNAFYNESKFHLTKKGNNDIIRELNTRLDVIVQKATDDYKIFIEPIHQLYNEFCTAYCALVDKLEGEKPVKNEEFDAILNEINDNEANYSINLQMLLEDLKALYANMKIIDVGLEKQLEWTRQFEAFDKRLGNVYLKTEELKTLFIQYFDKDGLFDSSLSKSFANIIGNKKKKPFYFIKPNDIKVDRLKHTLGAFVIDEVETWNFSITVDAIREKLPHYILDTLITLQHYPKLLERFIFNCKIDIKNDFGGIMDDVDWKGIPMPMEWFSKFRDFPASIFFFEDNEVRGYILMGDMKFDEKDIAESGDKVALKGEVLQEVCTRLYNMCHFFFLFCHNTGFDPTDSIDDLITYTGLPVTLKQVKEGFKESLKNGIKVGAGANE